MEELTLPEIDKIADFFVWLGNLSPAEFDFIWESRWEHYETKMLECQSDGAVFWTRLDPINKDKVKSYWNENIDIENP